MTWSVRALKRTCVSNRGPLPPPRHKRHPLPGGGGDREGQVSTGAIPTPKLSSQQRQLQSGIGIAGRRPEAPSRAPPSIFSRCSVPREGPRRQHRPPGLPPTGTERGAVRCWQWHCLRWSGVADVAMPRGLPRGQLVPNPPPFGVPALGRALTASPSLRYASAIRSRRAPSDTRGGVDVAADGGGGGCWPAAPRGGLFTHVSAAPGARPAFVVAGLPCPPPCGKTCTGAGRHSPDPRPTPGPGRARAIGNVGGRWFIGGPKPTPAVQEATQTSCWIAQQLEKYLITFPANPFHKKSGIRGWGLL